MLKIQNTPNWTSLSEELQQLCQRQHQQPHAEVEERIDSLYHDLLRNAPQLANQTIIFNKIKQIICENQPLLRKFSFKVSSGKEMIYIDRFIWSAYSEYYQRLFQLPVKENLENSLVMQDEASVQALVFIDAHLKNPSEKFQACTNEQKLKIYQLAHLLLLEDLQHLMEIQVIKPWINELFKHETLDTEQNEFLRDILSCRPIMRKSLKDHIQEKFKSKGIAISLSENSFQLAFWLDPHPWFKNFRWYYPLLDYGILEFKWEIHCPTPFLETSRFREHLSTLQRFINEWKACSGKLSVFLRIGSDLSSMASVEHLVDVLTLDWQSREKVPHRVYRQMFSKMKNLQSLTLSTFDKDFACIAQLTRLKKLTLYQIKEDKPWRIVNFAGQLLGKLLPEQLSSTAELDLLIPKLTNLEELLWPRNLPFDLRQSLPPSIKVLKVSHDSISNIEALKSFFDKNIFLEEIWIRNGHFELDDREFHQTTIPDYFGYRTFNFREEWAFESHLQIIKPMRQ